MSNATCWYALPRAYDDLPGDRLQCSGSVQFRVHDRRGCVLVCAAHAEWRKTTSQGMGHSRDCPNAGDKFWRQITQVTEGEPNNGL